MSSFKLTNVPVTSPHMPSISIAEFFAISHPEGRFDDIEAQINSIIGGKPNANAVGHSAPMSDMNRLSSGTSSDIITKEIEQNELSFFLLAYIRVLTNEEHHYCSEQ